LFTFEKHYGTCQKAERDKLTYLCKQKNNLKTIV